MNSTDPHTQRAMNELLSQIRSAQRQINNVQDSLTSREVESFASSGAIGLAGDAVYALRKIEDLARKWGAR